MFDTALEKLDVKDDLGITGIFKIIHKLTELCWQMSTSQFVAVSNLFEDDEVALLPALQT